MEKISLPALDRISQPTERLLFISNGQGEDVITLRILESIHELLPNLALEVLPLVGEGKLFHKAIDEGWLKKIGPSSLLPSGGFSNQSFRGLFSDINSGLFSLLWKQWKIVRLAASENKSLIAVGDLLPLFFVWTSGAPFGFIGTPKSDFTWRSGPGYSLTDCYHSIKGSEWDPWEWTLMRSSRCKIVAVRDQITARGLKSHGVQALAPGNPMMDGLEKDSLPQELTNFRRLILLCGSRMPEALQNFKGLMNSLVLVDSSMRILTFVALGSQPTANQIGNLLEQYGYVRSSNFKAATGAISSWIKDKQVLLIGPGKFNHWANWAEIGIATAGTATEQLVGLGIPALSLPGRGPQFKKSFAKRQSRLLGGAVVPCRSSEILLERLYLLLKDNSLRNHLGTIGTKRMGLPGGSSQLAVLIFRNLLEK